MADLTPHQKDVLVRTVLGEAANQGADGMAAVAAVIKNRADSGRFGSSDPAVIATQRNQFSANNPLTNGGNNVGRNASPNGAAYQRALAAVDGVFGGSIPDPTNGATYYHTGAVNPSWDDNMYTTAQIGAHTFYSPAPVPPASIPSRALANTSAPIDTSAIGYASPAGNAALRAIQSDAGPGVPLASGPSDSPLYGDFAALDMMKRPGVAIPDAGTSLALDPVNAPYGTPVLGGDNSYYANPPDLVGMLHAQYPSVMDANTGAVPTNGLGVVNATPPSPAPAQPQTVNINGHPYVVGQSYQLKNGASFTAQANGTFTKTANPIGNPTPLQLAIKAQAPGAMANLTNIADQAKGLGGVAASAVPQVGSFLSHLFGGGSAPAKADTSTLLGGNGGWAQYLAAPSIAPSRAAAPVDSATNGGWNAFLPENTMAGGAQLPAGVVPAGAASAMAQANAANTAMQNSHPQTTGDISQQLAQQQQNASSWSNLQSSFLPSSSGSSSVAMNNPGYSYAPSASEYQAPASVNVPKYITVSKQVQIPSSQPIETGSGVHWDATAGNYVLDAAPKPAPPTYRTEQIQVPNPNYVPPAPVVPPRPAVADTSGIGGWFAGTPLGHITSFMQGQQPSGGLLGMLMGGQQPQSSGGLGGVLHSILASPSPSQITGPAVAASNLYAYAPNASGGYTNVGTTTPNLTPAQQYQRAAGVNYVPTSVEQQSNDHNSSLAGGDGT